ncbi:MAG TPA: PAS domain-containing sensor histidine kinase [Flavobacterium sp.]|nr:PAS domain-containing sensor histidine kinase [Flavobacterium sp.]
MKMNGPEHLESSRKDLQKVADFLPYPFIIAEDFGNLHLNTYLNEKFLEEIGYTLDEIPTIESWYLHAYPDEAYRNEVVRNWDKEEKESTQKGKVFVKKQSLVTCKNGSRRWYEIKASVINKIHVIAFVDIDKEVTLQEELKNINSNNDRMLSILGHDLRSPVANLMTLSSMATNTEISSDEFVLLIHQINEQSIQVLELLDRTLNWAKLNFDTIQPQTIPINVTVLTDMIFEIYKAAYQSKNITIDAVLEKDAVINSDLEIVTIIVRNIISNAIKFTPQNGVIQIRFNQNELVIIDSGIGMTDRMIDDVLNKTYVSRRGTNNEVGIGIGLQLVKSLTEKINCKLSIASVPNRGTTIRLAF